MDCSRSEVGNLFLNKRAQGKFCQITVKVENIGKKAQDFDGSSQKALDPRAPSSSCTTACSRAASRWRCPRCGRVRAGGRVALSGRWWRLQGPGRRT
ncbi:DUF4352 domain-containing protein [Winogradskya consettensis]|uniref:DUF4352 domain-containing protein n=1 Tax=Winogradskya consettensis TaxID=113560 RepID=UPI001FD22815|nr:DUF4352 domain-containing protein [Actinoplanes consettensis]